MCGVDGRLALLTRSADLRQAQHTSNIDDIRIWKDGEDADPTLDLKAMLADLGVRGRFGVEFDSYGLTHFNGLRLQAALAGVVELVDASRLIPRLRATKSAEELVFVREAARLSDLADAAAIAATCAGADEGEILAAMHAAIFAAGGDYPANEFIIGSGADALLCRYKSGRRRLSSRRPAHARIRWRQPPLSRRDHAHACSSAARNPSTRPITLRRARRWTACAAELRPGRTAGEVFAAHARVFDAHGLSRHRLNACGYSLGAKFTPSWMDPPMFYERNPFVIAPRPGLFSPHDPDGQRQRRGFLPRAHLSRRRSPCRTVERARSGPRRPNRVSRRLRMAAGATRASKRSWVGWSRFGA